MSPTRKKFLSPEVLDEAAAQMAAIASKHKPRPIPTALVGGYALQLYGSDRLTGDIDIVATVDFLPGDKALSFGGSQTRAPNGVPVDLIVRDDDYADLYEEALHRAVPLPGVPMRVVTPEYLSAMKLVAGRARDSTDLDWLILSEVVDVKRARAIIKPTLGPYAAQEWDRLVDEVRWRASRGRT